MNTTPEMMAYLRSWAGPIPLVHRGLEWLEYYPTKKIDIRGILQLASFLGLGQEHVKHVYYDLKKECLLVGQINVVNEVPVENLNFDEEYVHLSRMYVAKGDIIFGFDHGSVFYTINSRGKLVCDCKTNGGDYEFRVKNLKLLKDCNTSFTITNPILFWAVALKNKKLTSALERIYGLRPVDGQ